MKTAAKVFLIIGTIFGFFTIIAPIIGILSVKKINKATKKDELTGLGVCSLLFVNLLGGIFMLCISEKELAANAPAVEAPKAENTENN